MIQTQATSTRFVYTYEDSLSGAQQRAIALSTTCESDLDRLESLFGETGGFSATNRITIEVNNPGGGLASNFGYHSDGSTKITMTPWSGVNPIATADEGARLELVAELSEIMMSLRNSRKGKDSWNPAGSNGEGLSQYCAELFYRDAYYDAQLSHGPDRIQRWLNDAGRPDWITTTEGTDRNFVSFGCAFLFLHFLHTQKLFSVHDIITKGGATLEDTYTNLTGSSGGWTEFKGLLDRFYPTGHTYAPTTCNLFPLYDDNRRSVSFEVARIPHPATVGAGGIASVSPFIFCPVGTYSWQWVDPNEELQVTARLSGFGNPVTTWVVDGVDVPAGGGQIAVSGPVDLDNPSAPGHPSTSTQSFHLTTSNQDASNIEGAASQLRLGAVEHPGDERLSIAVRVSEQFTTVPAFSSYTWNILHTHDVRYEPQFYIDRDACRKHLDELLHRYLRYKHIIIALTLPDPPPDVLAAARVINELRHELAHVAEREPEIARQFADEIGRTLRIAPELVFRGVQREG